MKSVQLLPHDLIHSGIIAGIRFGKNAASGVKDRAVGNDDPFKYAFEGVAGEIAFCRAFNVMPDLSYHPRGPTDRGDVTYKGKRIDVKTRKRSASGESPMIIAPHWKRPDYCDYLALMIGGWGDYKYTCAGFIACDDLICTSRSRDWFGRGPTFAAPVGDLMEDI